jgi:hypothetical protein
VSPSFPAAPLSVSFPEPPVIVLCKAVAAAREIADADEAKLFYIGRQREACRARLYNVGSVP